MGEVANKRLAKVLYWQNNFCSMNMIFTVFKTNKIICVYQFYLKA